MSVRVTLAVGEHDHTWSEEDVYLPDTAGPNVRGAALAAWGSVNGHRAVAFLTLLTWEYVDESTPEGKEREADAP